MYTEQVLEDAGSHGTLGSFLKIVAWSSKWLSAIGREAQSHATLPEFVLLLSKREGCVALLLSVVSQNHLSRSCLAGTELRAKPLLPCLAFESDGDWWKLSSYPYLNTSDLQTSQDRVFSNLLFVWVCLKEATPKSRVIISSFSLWTCYNLVVNPPFSDTPICGAGVRLWPIRPLGGGWWTGRLQTVLLIMSCVSILTVLYHRWTMPPTASLSQLYILRGKTGKTVNISVQSRWNFMEGAAKRGYTWMEMQPQRRSSDTTERRRGCLYSPWCLVVSHTVHCCPFQTSVSGMMSIWDDYPTKPQDCKSGVPFPIDIGHNAVIHQLLPT